jgi:peptide/nickel transport system permease protein
VVVLVVLLVAAIFAPLLSPYSPNANDLEATYGHISAAHWLGTDDLGRDLLSRIMYGGRGSLLGVAEALAVYLVLGLTFGVLAGYLGGVLEAVVVWVADVSFALPQIIVVLSVLAIFANNSGAAMLALGILGAPGLAVFARGATRTVREELYISAARVSGLRTVPILVRHIMPQITGSVIVQVSLFSGTALLFQTGMDFLGLGTQPPTPTWGGMVAEASTFMGRDIWMVMPSGIVIVLAIVAFGLVGDAAQDVLSAAKGQGPTRTPASRIATTSQATEVVDRDETLAEVSDTARLEASREPRTPLAHVRGAEANGVRDARSDVPRGDGVLLSVRNLTVAVESSGASIVQNVSFDLRPGQCLGIVGESGCGKTMTALSLIGLLPDGVSATGGSLTFRGEDLRAMDEKQYRRVRGSGIAMISQEPISSLDPSFTVMDQIAEVVRRHSDMSRQSARAEAMTLLEQVRIPNADTVAKRYPHQLSGGMAQRVSIAAALAGNPAVLIADEPTTALDVTVQAEILQLLRSLRETGLAMILVSHDWGVIADSCDAAVVMYAGQVVEEAAIANVFEHYRHPYSYGLMESNPQFATAPRTPLPAVPGTVPPVGEWPVGCHFAARCQFASSECSAAPIALDQVERDHWARCIHTDQVANSAKVGVA